MSDKSILPDDVINPLVGKCFVILGKDGAPMRQGVVRSWIDNEHYLVQFFSYVTGNPTSLAVVNIRSMARYDENNFAWEFFDTDEDLRRAQGGG